MFDSEQIGESMEQRRFKLTALVRGDSFWYAVACDPVMNQSTCYFFSCPVLERNDFWESCESIDDGEALIVASRDLEFKQIDVDVFESSGQRFEVGYRR